MTNTEFIQEIIQELEKNQVQWSNEKELFEIIVFSVSDEVWKKKYKAKWSSWRWRKRVKYNTPFKGKGTYIESLSKSPDILKAIAITLKFDISLWDKDNITQKETIQKCVTKLLNNNDVDLSSLISTEPKINQEQQQLLEKLNTQAKSSVEKIVSQNMEFFSKKIKNQDFLLQLLPILYQKSHFKILNEKLFPSLYRHHLDKIDIKIKEANTLTNLENPDYDDIISILISTEYSTVEESIDINTMIISNIKRKTINSHIKNHDALKTLLWMIIEYYDKVYQKPFNYYPAINLVYTVKLFVTIFPNHQEANCYDLDKIYKSVKLSIKEDNKKGGDSKYYATMSNLEFRLLLGGRGVLADLYILLEELSPPTLLVEQTIAQMRWFLEVLENFGQMDKYLLDELLKVVEILEGYEGAK